MIWWLLECYCSDTECNLHNIDYYCTNHGEIRRMSEKSSRFTLWYLLWISAVVIAILLYLFITIGQQRTARNESAEEYNGEIEVIEFEYWVSIQTDMWWRYAYRLQLRNNSNRDTSVQADITYLGSGGEVIDSTTTNILTVPAGEERRLSGHSLISVPGAKEVVDAEIIVRKKER